MRIAVSSDGTHLDAKVDPRFGRAARFLIYDTDNESIEIIDNNLNLQASQGAGIQTAETIARKNVDIVISGNIGPKALRALQAAGIKVGLWSDGSVAEAVEMARNDRIKLCDKASVEGHWM